MLDDARHESLARVSIRTDPYKYIFSVYRAMLHVSLQSYPASYLLRSEARGYVHDPTVLPEAVCT